MVCKYWHAAGISLNDRIHRSRWHASSLRVFNAKEKPLVAENCPRAQMTAHSMLKITPIIYAILDSSKPKPKVLNQLDLKCNKKIEFSTIQVLMSSDKNLTYLKI